MKVYEKLSVNNLKGCIGKTLFIAHKHELIRSKLIAITSLGNFIFEGSIEVMRNDVSNDFIKIYKVTPKTDEKESES